MPLHRPPMHTGGLKFSIGQAVYYAPLPSRRDATLTPQPGVVVGFTQHYIVVQLDSRRRRISPVELLHRGYCTSCGQAAELDSTGALVCFWCERPAVEMVPLDRHPAWENSADQFHALLIREMVTTGCTRYDAWLAVHERLDIERWQWPRAA